jgi:hypothetical protein
MEISCPEKKRTVFKKHTGRDKSSPTTVLHHDKCAASEEPILILGLGIRLSPASHTHTAVFEY